MFLFLFFFYFIFCRFYVNFITSEYVAVCFPLFFYDSFHFFCLYLFTVFLIYFMLNKPFYYSIKVLQTIIFLYFSIFFYFLVLFIIFMFHCFSAVWWFYAFHMEFFLCFQNRKYQQIFVRCVVRLRSCY